jgi:ERCC4-type nuclease
MSIFLDPRSGSGELLPYFKPYDVPVEVVQLDAGDAAFCGNGPNGPVLIGYERKVLLDAINSMRDDRFMGEQLPKLLDQYGLSITIILEGIWRAGPESGAIEIKGYDRGAGGYKKSTWVPVQTGSRWVMYRELDHWLSTLEHKISFEAGRQFNVVRTADEAQTAAYLVSRYKWWNDKEWEKHDSYKTIYSPDVPNPPGRKGFSIPRPGPVEEVACRFPGVREKAWSFGKRFESVHQMVNANETELESVEGIGKKGAATIYGWIRAKNGVVFVEPEPTDNGTKVRRRRGGSKTKTGGWDDQV